MLTESLDGPSVSTLQAFGVSDQLTVLQVNELPDRQWRRKSLRSRDSPEQICLPRVLVNQQGCIKQQQVLVHGCFKRQDVRHARRIPISADAGNRGKAGAIGQAFLQALYFLSEGARVYLK